MRKHKRFNSEKSADSFVCRLQKIPVVNNICKKKGGKKWSFRISYDLERGYSSIFDYEQNIKHGKYNK